MGGQRKKTGKKKKGGGGGGGAGRCGPDLRTRAADGAAKQQHVGGAGADASGDTQPRTLAGTAGAAQQPEAGGDEPAWVRVIVRRGRVKTQEWVRCQILSRSAEPGVDEVTVLAQGKLLQLTSAQVYVGPDAPQDSTRTMEDATRLRREISSARGQAVSSPVFRGPLPYENAVGNGWLQRDIERTREELLLCTARHYGMVVLSAVSHYESYISLLEHDILHVASDLERKAAVVKSLQRACRDQRRAAELERKHDLMVAQSHGYNTNVAALKAEAIAFRGSPITKKASVHVNHTWQKYGSSGEYMRKADVEALDTELSFESLLSEMKVEDERQREQSAGGAPGQPEQPSEGEAAAAAAAAAAGGGNGGGGTGGRQVGGGGDRDPKSVQITDPYISFGPHQWWWLPLTERDRHAAQALASLPAGKAGRKDPGRKAGRGVAVEDSGGGGGGAEVAVAKEAAAAAAALEQRRRFEESVLGEMARMSNAKLCGGPCTLLPGEAFPCRACKAEACCKAMVLMDGKQADHPFCFGCLTRAHSMLSSIVGGGLQYVPLDAVNYGKGPRGLPDRQPMSVHEAQLRFRAATAESLQQRLVGALAHAGHPAAQQQQQQQQQQRQQQQRGGGGGGGSPRTAAAAASAAELLPGALGQVSSAILGSIIGASDQAELERIDAMSRSLVESPLTADHLDWSNGTLLSEEQRAKARQVANQRFAAMRLEAMQNFQIPAAKAAQAAKAKAKAAAAAGTSK